MYLKYFGLDRPPFTIAPDPKFLFLSQRHREALGHLIYGVREQGGFVLLTGEVGTGKTTVCRCFLEQLPENTDVAFIVNPRLSVVELLATLCDELGVTYPKHTRSIKIFTDLLNAFLLENHRRDRNTTMIIDEAQNLSVDVLEQLRLLTNLETSEKKLLQIVLLGQPELQDLLHKPQLRQLSQRITARYHLTPLNQKEVTDYIRYRLQVAGCQRELFPANIVRLIYRYTGGIPRQINLLADRALLGTYSRNLFQVGKSEVKQAAKEIGNRKSHILSAVLSQKIQAYRTVLLGMTAFVLSFGIVGMAGMMLANQRQASVDIAPPSQLVNYAENNDVMLETEVNEAPKIVAARDQTTVPMVTDLNSVVHTRLATARGALLAVWRHTDESLVTELEQVGCDSVQTLGLQCARRTGTWRTMIEINRPMILFLKNADGEALFVVPVAINGSQVTVLTPSGQKVVEQQWLDQWWWGEYEFLWRTPSYESLIVSPGQSKTKEQWLLSALDEIIAAKATEIDEVTRSFLVSTSQKEKIIWVQKQLGLQADGIVGEQTIIALNRYLYPDTTPLLR